MPAVVTWNRDQIFDVDGHDEGVRAQEQQVSQLSFSGN